MALAHGPVSFIFAHCRASIFRLTSLLLFRDRSQPLEKRADVLGRCLRMMASVYFPKFKDSIGEMMFALCNSDGKQFPPAHAQMSILI